MLNSKTWLLYWKAQIQVISVIRECCIRKHWIETQLNMTKILGVNEEETEKLERDLVKGREKEDTDLDRGKELW